MTTYVFTYINTAKYGHDNTVKFDSYKYQAWLSESVPHLYLLYNTRTASFSVEAITDSEVYSDNLATLDGETYDPVGALATDYSPQDFDRWGVNSDVYLRDLDWGTNKVCDPSHWQNWNSVQWVPTDEARKLGYRGTVTLQQIWNDHF